MEYARGNKLEGLTPGKRLLRGINQESQVDNAKDLQSYYKPQGDCKPKGAVDKAALSDDSVA